MVLGSGGLGFWCILWGLRLSRPESPQPQRCRPQAPIRDHVGYEDKVLRLGV